MTNELALSSDIHVITAEINAYQRMVGESIFEIGKRLKHVKENDLVHGEWEEWCKDKINISPQYSNKFIKVYEELGDSNRISGFDLGVRALYEIATLPKEEREKEHQLNSGETKTVDEMTVRELAELKKALKESKEQVDQFEQRTSEKEQELQTALENEAIAKKALEELEELASSQPQVIEVEKIIEVERIIDNTDHVKMEKMRSRMEKLSGEIEILRVKEVTSKEEKKKYKQELEEKESRLLALTQEQLKSTSKRLIRGYASSLSRDVGGYMRSLRLNIIENGNVDGDEEVHSTVSAMIKILEETINEAKSWIEIEGVKTNVNDTEGMIVDAEFEPIS